MKARTLNMTTGSPLKLLTRFSLPLLIGNLFQQAYNLADSIIVGRLVGANALAAVGATASVTFLFFSVSAGIGNGSGIVTSQLFGAGDDDKVKTAISNSAYLMFGSALIMGLLAFLAAPHVLRFLGTPQEILPDAVLYMRTSSVGVPLIGVYNYSSSMQRALGDSKTPLVFLIVACVLNVFMDLLFVYVFHMGVFGAALATVIAQFISGVGCLTYALRCNPYFKLKREHFAFNRRITWSAVRIGMPLALQWSLIAVSTTALQRFVNSFGASAVAAFTATTRIEQLVQQPYGSLGMALSTYAGQNFGAGRLDRVRTGLRDSVFAAAAFSAVMLIVMQIFGDEIISAFIREEEVVRMGARALRLTSCFYFFLGVIYVTRGTLNGIGDALFALINGVVEMICRIFLPTLLVLLPGVGVWGIWWTAGLTWMISGVFCCLRYFAWRRKTFGKGGGASKTAEGTA